MLNINLISCVGLFIIFTVISVIAMLIATSTKKERYKHLLKPYERIGTIITAFGIFVLCIMKELKGLNLIVILAALVVTTVKILVLYKKYNANDGKDYESVEFLLVICDALVWQVVGVLSIFNALLIMVYNY